MYTSLDEDLWCKGKYILKENFKMGTHYGPFLDKINISELKLDKCPVPCKVKRYQATQIGLTRKSFGGMKIWFEQEVDVTRSSFQIDEKTLLSNIGGFIGVGKEFLWLVILLLSSFTVLMSYIKEQNLNKPA